jgi:hypothetical protein
MARWRRRLQPARRAHGCPGADGSEPPRKGPGRFTPI